MICGGVALLLILGISTWIVINRNDMVDQDFFTFWLGANLTVNGKDVYDPQVWTEGHLRYGSTWLENQYYVYPLPLAVLQAPLGLLPVKTAAILWLSLSMVSIFLAVMFLGGYREYTKRPIHLIILLAGIFLSRPVIVTVLNGQLGAIFLIIFILAIYLIYHLHDYPGGILLAILLLKPTLGFPIVGLVIIYLLINRRWKAIAGFFLAVLGLACIGWLTRPDWIQAFIKLGLSKGQTVFLWTPTWWGLAASLCRWDSPCANMLGLSGSILLSVAAVLFTVRNAKHWSIWMIACMSVVMGLFLTPYLWAYDQVLLILPLLWITIQYYRRYRPTFALVLPIVFSLLSYLLLIRAMNTSEDTSSVWMTIIIGLLFFLTVNTGLQNEQPVH